MKGKEGIWNGKEKKRKGGRAEADPKRKALGIEVTG